jgi:hypothetical protein
MLFVESSVPVQIDKLKGLLLLGCLLSRINHRSTQGDSQKKESDVDTDSSIASGFEDCVAATIKTLRWM